MQFALAQSSEFSQVSTNSLVYSCFECDKVPENIVGGAISYTCNQPNCELTASKVERGRISEIALIKFGNSKTIFKKIDNEFKLLSLEVLKANAEDAPFEINDIKIPYVSAGDMIDFASANLLLPNSRPTYTSTSIESILPINANYFNRFYYLVGVYNQQEIPLKRNPSQASADLTRPLGRSVKRGEWRPVSLCGYDFFDAITETVNLNSILGRQLNDVPRESWFYAEMDDDAIEKCAIRNYRISTRNDPVYLNNPDRIRSQANVAGGYARDYLCGSIPYSIHDSHATNLDCNILANGEGADMHQTKLSCPSRQEGNYKKEACQQNSEPSMLIGSTRYFFQTTDGLLVSAEDTLA